MTSKVLESVKRFQEFILEVGLARGVLALPAPRMLALTSTSGEGVSANNVFTLTVTEAEIEEVSKDLFASGHYSLAVQEAYKAVDKYVGGKTGILHISGTQLMDQVFSPNNPILFWSSRTTTSEKDEQMGYHRLFSGSMLGIRNPVIHEFAWIEEADVALELLVFAQHLLRKAKAARLQ